MYQKFQADHLFTGTRLLDKTHVLICTDTGVVEEIIPASEAGDDIQQLNGVLSPGFINCHCHLELSHMHKLIAEGTGLVDFVFKIVTQRHFPDEEILDAIDTGEKEMLLGGIVAVGDICNNTLTVPQKQKQNLYYYNFIETSGWLPELAQTRFDRSLDVYNTFSELAALGSGASISPHAPYSVSENLWQLIQPYFNGKTITIHNQETAFEDALFETATGDFTRMYEMMRMDTSFFKPTGKSSLQSFFPNLQEAAQVLLIHNTFTKEADITYTTQHAANVNWCLCVNANRYIENALPPVTTLRDRGCTMVIGTDSLASNRSLSILDELKTISSHFPEIPLQELLQWATYNGAKALQMSDRLGSFEKGKQPGILLLENTDSFITEKSKVLRLL